MSDKGGVIAALAKPENLQAHIHTRYYTADDPEPTMMSCEAAGPILAAELANYFNTTNPALNRALREGMGRNQTATPKTWTDVSDFYASNASLAGVDAQRTSANIMLYQMTTDVFKCGNQAADPNAYFSCTQLLSDQQQAFAVDAAAGGSGMTRTMITSMGFLLALFFGLSPLVLLVALASGANALPLLGKYLMFGTWTQSWLPAAFLINFFIIHTWTKATDDMVTRFGDSIPLEAVPLFWMETSDKIAVASDLLASVPLITLAAMTGSYFALAKLGERWSGKDYSQERMVAPQLATVNPVSSNASIREHSEGKGGQTVGAARPQISVSDALSKTVADRDSEMHQTAKQTMDKWSVGGAFENTWSRFSKSEKNDGTEAGRMAARAASFMNNIEKKINEDDSLTKEQKQQVSAASKAAIGYFLAGSGAGFEASISGAGSTADIQKWMRTHASGQQWQNAMREEFSTRNYSGFQRGEGFLSQYGFSKKEAKETVESGSELASISKAREEAIQLSQNIGMSMNMEPGQYHHMVARNDGAHFVQTELHGKLYESPTAEGQRYTEAFDRIARTEKGNGVQAHDAQFGWMATAAQMSGNHDMIATVAYQLLGGGSPNSMVLGKNMGVGDSVATPHVTKGMGVTYNVAPKATDRVTPETSTGFNPGSPTVPPAGGGAGQSGEGAGQPKDALSSALQSISGHIQQVLSNEPLPFTVVEGAPPLPPPGQMPSRTKPDNPPQDVKDLSEQIEKTGGKTLGVARDIARTLDQRTNVDHMVDRFPDVVNGLLERDREIMNQVGAAVKNFFVNDKEKDKE